MLFEISNFNLWYFNPLPKRLKILDMRFAAKRAFSRSASKPNSILSFFGKGLNIHKFFLEKSNGMSIKGIL